MKRPKFTWVLVACAALAAGTASSALAQPADNGPGGGTPPGGNPGNTQGGGRRGNRPGGGNFDPAQMRERMMTRLKEQLEATDEEWTALQPKLEKVMTAQRSARGGFGGGRGRGPGGPGGPGGESTQPQTPVAKASLELRTTLNNKSASADEIKAKLAALRDAKEKAKAELAAAQKELKDLLTQRQEAVLVNDGLLD